MVNGIPVTSVARTLLDLGGSSDSYVVEAALRNAEFRELSSPVGLPELIRRHPRHRGARAAKAALARIAESPGGRTRSTLEELFLPFLDTYRIERPFLNAQVDTDERSYEVDCLWPQRRLIAELDGFASHGTRHAFRHDRRRDRDLTTAGYRVIRITEAQLSDESSSLARDLNLLLLNRPSRSDSATT